MSGLRDKIRAKRQQIADKSAGQERSYKLSNGKTFFRLLPGVGDLSEFYQEIGIHWIKDAAGKVITAVGDREICYGEPCPIRQAINRFIEVSAAAEDDVAVKRGKDMLAKSRFYVGVVILKAPGEFTKDKPEIIDLPQSAFDQILSQIEDAIEELPEGADLATVGPFAFATGATFCIEKSGSGLETRYNAYIAATKPQPIKASVMEAAVDLAAFKRAQFDSRTRKALAALGDMIGTDLTELAGSLAAPAGIRAAALPKPDADDDIIDGDIEEIEDAADEVEEPVSDDDILADLDDL